MIDWKEYVTELAETEIDGETGLRIQMASLTAANTVMLLYALLYIGGMSSAEEAAGHGIIFAMILFGAYLVFRHSPAIARVIERRFIE